MGDGEVSGKNYNFRSEVKDISCQIHFGVASEISKFPFKNPKLFVKVVDMRFYYYYLVVMKK